MQPSFVSKQFFQNYGFYIFLVIVMYIRNQITEILAVRCHIFLVLIIINTNSALVQWCQHVLDIVLCQLFTIFCSRIKPLIKTLTINLIN